MNEETKAIIKRANERITRFQMGNKVYDELTKLRADNARLTTQLEITQEMFKLLNAECKKLEDENTKLKWTL